MIVSHKDYFFFSAVICCFCPHTCRLRKIGTPSPKNSMSFNNSRKGHITYWKLLYSCLWPIINQGRDRWAGIRSQHTAPICPFTMGSLVWTLPGMMCGWYCQSWIFCYLSPYNIESWWPGCVLELRGWRGWLTHPEAGLCSTAWVVNRPVHS